jgi:glycosyltransferase involved in cell wall biosynthesis
VLGYVNDDELAWLYANCFTIVYPSLYEGFGLPVLEAMSMGAAVVTSQVTSLPEVAGPAASYVNPYDFARIVNEMAGLLTNETNRAQMKQKALAFREHILFVLVSILRTVKSKIDRVLGQQRTQDSLIFGFQRWKPIVEGGLSDTYSVV